MQLKVTDSGLRINICWCSLSLILSFLPFEGQCLTLKVLACSGGHYGVSFSGSPQGEDCLDPLLQGLPCFQVLMSSNFFFYSKKDASLPISIGNCFAGWISGWI